jgi:hypothetical protein
VAATSKDQNKTLNQIVKNLHTKKLKLIIACYHSNNYYARKTKPEKMVSKRGTLPLEKYVEIMNSTRNS